MVLLLIILLILLLIFFVNKYLSNIENFSNYEIIFYKKKNLYNILKKDDDNYFNSFFDNDLKVRNINTIDDYYIVLNNSLCNPDNENINKIKNYIIKIKSIINKLKNNNTEINSINLNKFNNLKWKIGFVCNNNYENGLPHTRGDIIILNKNKFMVNSDEKNMKTLIHEQVHVYQKKYPDELNYYLKKNNFTKLKKRTKYDNIRANPDLNNYIYKDSSNNTYKAIYNSNPKSIEDITYYPYNEQLYEHPNERMAIEFEKILDN